MALRPVTLRRASSFPPAYFAHAVPLIAFSAWAAFASLGRRSLWYDELFSVVSASTSSSIHELVRTWASADPHPPGYAVLLFGWFRVFPATETWARLPSAALAVATTAYLLFGRNVRVGPSGRLFSALLFVSGSATLYYSQTSRPYEFFLAGTLFALLELLNVSPGCRRSPASWVRLTFVLLATSYVHFFGVLAWLAVMAAAIHREVRQRVSVRDAIYAVTAFCVGYLPGWLWMYRTARIASDQAPIAFKTFVSGYFRYIFFDRPALLLALGGILLLVPAALRRVTLDDVVKDLRSSAQFRLVAAAFTVLVFAFVTLATITPVLQLRYALIFYSPLLLLVALWCDSTLPFSSRIGKACFWATLCLGIANYGVYRQTEKQDWRKSAEYVAAHAVESDSLYVLDADPRIPPAEYLARGDLDGYIYCRNLSFYRFYFQRLHEAVIGQRLRPLNADATDILDTLTANDAPTTYVLGAHHLTLPDDSLDALSEHYEIEQIWLQSTVVYKLTVRTTALVRRSGPGSIQVVSATPQSPLPAP